MLNMEFLIYQTKLLRVLLWIWHCHLCMESHLKLYLQFIICHGAWKGLLTFNSKVLWKVTCGFMLLRQWKKFYGKNDDIFHIVNPIRGVLNRPRYILNYWITWNVFDFPRFKNCCYSTYTIFFNQFVWWRNKSSLFWKFYQRIFHFFFFF